MEPLPAQPAGEEWDRGNGIGNGITGSWEWERGDAAVPLPAQPQPILRIFPLFFFPCRTTPGDLTTEEGFSQEFSREMNPKLHYPSLLSRYYPAFFGITAPLSPQKNLPRFFFFLDVGRVWSSTRNPPGIIQGLQFHGIWDFWDLPAHQTRAAPGGWI